MDSLEMMYKMGLKNTAAYNLPQQMQNDRAAAAEDLRTKQIANDQSMVMNPLNAQFRQGQIAEQGAILPGQQAAARSLVSNANVDTATESARIAQRLSSLSNQMGVDGVQKMAREGAIASQAAAALKNYPPALHKEILPKLYMQYGGDPHSPLLQGFMSMPDGEIAKALATTGQGMAMASHEYLQKSALQANENNSQERIAKGNNSTSIEVAKIQAASREAAARARAAAMAKIPKTEDRIAILEEAEANGEATPQESELLRRLKNHVYNEKTLAAPATAPEVMGQETPTARAARLAQGSTPQAAAPQAPDIQQALQAAGMPYEPNKYEYRIGPNGQPQRKAK
jgi:hypothetical protein